MPISFICNQPSLNIQLLCKHFIICHPDYNFIEYSCAEISCNRSFHLINSFKKHLATHIINEPLIFLKPLNTDSVNKRMIQITLLAGRTKLLVNNNIGDFNIISGVL